MIVFTDVSKTYVSKSKSKVEALKQVSFTLGEQGMTFILGKSGSGKSTLLNLLGGLDRPTFGNIQVDGTDMQLFKQSDYESYRNGYVGFVFQEYNLLDDFNVRDNVALALQLSKEADVEAKVKQALKQVELTEEYLTRRVGELSGGEKQRVAIARAIVKDSKIILADEPTGNLDSETGESIWKILKNISQEHLVVVVSHDRESAERYSDRTIEISDGRIISDNGSEQAEVTNSHTFEPTKKRLSFAMLLKMGFNSLFKRKARAICVILVSAFTLCALLVSQLILTYLPERGIAKHITKHDTPYITVGQGHAGNHVRRESDMMRYATREYVTSNAQTLEWGYAENKRQLLDFGLEFVGKSLELDEKSFYISEQNLDELMTRGRVLLDGQETSIAETDYTAENLIGKQVCAPLYLLDGYGYYVLAGIVKSINVDLPEYIALEGFEGRQFPSPTLNASATKD